jgi:hypothetical protein
MSERFVFYSIPPMEVILACLPPKALPFLVCCNHAFLIWHVVGDPSLKKWLETRSVYLSPLLDSKEMVSKEMVINKLKERKQRACLSSLVRRRTVNATICVAVFHFPKLNREEKRTKHKTFVHREEKQETKHKT